MPVRILARTLPYRQPLFANERVCTRCGIVFRLGQPARDNHLTKCRDCRHLPETAH